jgi:transglutaminase-like putative cysteine protease
VWLDRPGRGALDPSARLPAEGGWSRPGSPWCKERNAMNRRRFLRSATLASAAFALPGAARALGRLEADDAGTWRTFEVTTHVDVLKPAGMTRVWVPVPLTIETPYQQPLGNVFNAEDGAAKLVDDHARGFGMVAAEWRAGANAVLTVTSRVKTRNITVDLINPAPAGAPTRAALARFLEPSALIPSDGIVKDTAVEITRGAKTDLERARAIYDWIVDHTFRDPNTRGCGIGDIRFMLQSGNLGGKCADLNALYVGLAHAAGLAARDAYGVRVAKSELGYKSLGLASDNASKAQHCRAEVFLTGFGWVPVDPADVRKVVLEEPPGNLALDNEMVRRARTRLFGAWEMNWVAYNFEHDVTLPGSTGAKIPYFMYPQGETADGRLDSLDPDAFKYTITTREVTAPE